MTILPVPPSVPALSMRARLVSVPGLSLPYQLRISRTRSVVGTDVLLQKGGPGPAGALVINPRVHWDAAASSAGRRTARLRTSLAALLDQLGDQTRPARLVIGADATA